MLIIRRGTNTRREAPIVQQKKIVFFFPAFSSQEATAPLGILAVSTPLLRAGYQVKIVDSTITPNFQQRVLEELEDALCLAVSLVTGPMIRETVQIARAAKRLYPRLPVVLGGWHPSLLPDQTLAAEYVDVVVVGQGEDALLDVVRHIEDGSSLRGIPGVGFKEEGSLVFNPSRPLRPLCEMPPKAYHLADFDAYERVCGRRWAMYTSSLACPYNCGYCTNDGVYGRKWNALEPGQVVEETTELVTRNRLELLWIVDDNFLIDRERALGIAEGLVRRGVRFDWSIQASTNLVNRLSVEEWKLLRRSGLSQVSQGADTGSPKMMHLMNKDFQDLDTIYGAAEKLSAAGVRPSFNLIFGYPGETEKERHESVALMMDICRRYPGAEFWTNIFTPYPGSPIMKRAFELGIETPKTMEGWADFFPRYTVLPWLKGREHQRVQNMREYMRVAFHRVPIGKYRVPAMNRALFDLIGRPARWRLDHHVYAFPVELWLRKAAQRVLTPPKPKVDAHQLSAEPVTC
ncbi:MAG: B12-binding domain-containing radical SAM protein [Terriglobia bacterium]|nr:MAG: B12-binding domain-containing radical SAM protein [Terriglobia bacterium]